MVKAYETIYILDPSLDDARWDEEIEAVKSIITGKGGEVKEVQKWGRRRLAYEIAKKKEGIYTLIRFDSTADVPAELDRRFRLNESVMRHLVVLFEVCAPPAVDDGLGDSHGHGRGPRGFGGDRDRDRDSDRGRDRDNDRPRDRDRDRDRDRVPHAAPAAASAPAAAAEASREE